MHRDNPLNPVVGYGEEYGLVSVKRKISHLVSQIWSEVLVSASFSLTLWVG